MTVQNVTWNVKNGRLGVQAPGGVLQMAVVGPCSGGAIATPTRHVRSDDLLATYPSGPAPELAMGAIEHWRADVLMCRSTSSNASSFGSIDVTGVTGACVVTKHSGATSDDDYEAGFVVVTGGTVGVTGITYQTTLDNFRTLSTPIALGTATTILIANSGGVQFDLTAATLNAKDKVSILAIAPVWSSGDLSTALAALKASNQAWEAAYIVGPVNATIAAVIKTFLDGVESTKGQEKRVYCHARMPNPGESEATYLASIAADIIAFADRRITYCTAAARVQSSRTGRPFIYRRPSLFAIAGLPQALPLGVDMSQTVDATPDGLPGVFLYDSNGNQVEHDEMINPGLDDIRTLSLRTWPGKAGVFVNNPTTLEQVGGDFHLDQMARILAVFCNTARQALVDELSRADDLNLKTSGPNLAGAITERVCQLIDTRVLAALENALKTQVSGLQFKLHRDDQILTTQTINAEGGIIFKGYPKLIVFNVSAINPAATA